MASTVPRLTLNNGRSIPILGLGTWNSKPGQVRDAVCDAIDAGYRHIDCAHIYMNEAEIGEALKAKMADGTVKREELFITSKLWNTFHSKELVLPALKTTLENLGLSYLDLYLIHWPMGFKEGGDVFPRDAEGNALTSEIDYVETYTVLEAAVKEGLIMSLGLSNFNSKQIARVEQLCEIKPAVVQVECHALLNQTKLIAYCKSKDVLVTAYSPLGSPANPFVKDGDPVLMELPQIVSIAAKHGKTPAQVLIKFQVQRGVICVPKSVTKSRIESNFQVFDFELSPEEMTAITDLDCSSRILVLAHMKQHPHYPFNTEF